VRRAKAVETKKAADGGDLVTRARRSKFGNRKTEVDGFVFDSAKEARRYQELRLLEKAGEIRALELQPKFALRVGDRFIGSYVADFKYFERTKPSMIPVYEDAKGFRTPLYRWKKKHVEAQYGITIRET
jgi:hypothetical protein